MSPAFAENFALGLARNKMPSLASNVNLLSDRELEVFRLLAAGRKTSDIAKDLSVSLKTGQSY